MRIKDRVSLITGASRGIGRAIALTLAKQGSDVILIYKKNTDKANRVANEIIRMGRKAVAKKLDVTQKDEVFNVVDAVVEKYGKIDVLVNNAGMHLRRNTLEAKKEEWDEILGVNLLGPYYCIQAVAPYMMKRKYGKIISVSSVASFGVAVEGQILYAPSKAALNILTKKLAYELGPYKINVNAIAPGAIMTEMLSYGKSEEEAKQSSEKVAKYTALGRMGQPQDIANLALFLASDESSFITGQVIVADGGRFNFLSHSI